MLTDRPFGSLIREDKPTKDLWGILDRHAKPITFDAIRIKLAAPQDWLFFNGAATAEMQVRQYSSIGITAYSSAVHSFAPEIAGAFFRAQRAGDDQTVETLLREFYVPLVELRDRGAGYAVSLVKAAATLRGEQVGPVRAPLTTPTAAHLRELGELIDSGLKLVENLPVLATVA